MERLDRQLGEYRILARLATGGQSEVFLAARGGPHGFFRPVVIKALPEEFKGDEKMEALFYQEAAISSRFDHPHVVTIHDARQAGDDHFMIMDYIAGQTVAELAQRAFSRGGGITLEETLVMLADACRGLDYVHSFEDLECREYSIVHCDISPQNLMVTYGGVTRVFDFGISQFTGEQDIEVSKTDLIGGKFSYMSPEQCRQEPLDTRSDIFSLGIILYELVTGRRLFRHSNEEEAKEAITSEPIEAPSEVAGHLDEDIDDVVMGALHRDLDERYQTAGEMAEALQEVLDERNVDCEQVRAGLGEKVESLFSDERDEIAELLGDARQNMQLWPVDDDEPSDREMELEQQLHQAREKMESLRENASRATEVASALTDEVSVLQSRQNWFIAGMALLALIAIAVAVMAVMSHEGSFIDDEPDVQATETVVDE